MMTVAEWRKRAHDCMTASRLAPDREGQLGWQALSDAWLAVAEWRDREKISGSERRVVEPFIETAGANSASEHGEQLRARLALLTDNKPIATGFDVE